ncbi:hypothetical protein SM0020_16251 [Sinorhizobium meliloti CCNWSX0020]|uniref:Uncharacterized protein n=1 Tax=Sinorhizobium meliloti CCNWSX0020 TaxID=1107881 RepID=H0G1B5_RHIML|nr:hypothetical protein SM0020_16251 [Sinorhizobium meliloti CCNWSX0020]
MHALARCKRHRHRFLSLSCLDHSGFILPQAKRSALAFRGRPSCALRFARNFWALVNMGILSSVVIETSVADDQP